ncbi:MAG: PAS domain-containing protein [Pseudomonadota bacterium]
MHALIDEHGAIWSANAAFCEMFEVERAEIEGRPLESLPIWSTRPDSVSRLIALARRSPDGRQEALMDRASGLFFEENGETGADLQVIAVLLSDNVVAVFVYERDLEPVRPSGGCAAGELLEELKNAFMITQSLISIAAEGSEGGELGGSTIETVVLTRLNALVRTIELMEERGDGIQACSLGSIVQSLLRERVEQDQAVEIEGPPVELTLRYGLIFAIVLHDVARLYRDGDTANGAVATLRVRWYVGTSSAGAEMLRMVWTGVPLVDDDDELSDRVHLAEELTAGALEGRFSIMRSDRELETILELDLDDDLTHQRS